MRWMRKVLRGLRAAARRLASRLRILWYRCLFEGFEAGAGVTIGRGAWINLPSGGRLVLGDRVHIGSGASLMAEGGTIEIGADGFIGPGCTIVAFERVAIGRDALIAAFVTIRDQDHGFARSDLPYRAQPLVSAPVEIGSNVWLGTHVTVTRGVTIGDGAIVGANSVVTSSLDGRTLSAGAPARTLRALDG